jgi:hypothetical protein
MSRLVTRAGALSPFGAGAPPMKAINSWRDGIASPLGAAGTAARGDGCSFGKVWSSLKR